jgi:hypothetical protein
MEGKQSHECTIKIVEPCATSPLVFVHIDFCGMIHLAYLGGAHYFISFTNDFRCFTWLYFLKQKFETLQAFKKNCAKVELQFIPFKLLAIHNNYEGEYVSGDFLTFCIKVSITHELIQAYTASHNGISEQNNCTLLEKARSMVVDAQNPMFL